MLILLFRCRYIEKDSKLIYGEGIQAVVEIGLIILTEGIYDDLRKEIRYLKDKIKESK